MTDLLSSVIAAHGGVRETPWDRLFMSLSSTDRGLLTPDNCAVIFIDHQPQMFFGVSLTAFQVLLEFQRDWSRKEHYEEVMAVAKEHCGAYGQGIEYAATMVQKAPASRDPKTPGSKII